MNEISIEEIDNFTITEVSQYLFEADEHSYTIAHKKIADVDTVDLLHLLRRHTYLETAVLLAIREMESNGFYGHSFKLDAQSITQQDILKELILLPDYFWNYNQRAYHKIKPIADKNGLHVNLSHKIVTQFLEFDPQPIIWTKTEIDQFVYSEAMGGLSALQANLDKLRQIKRAADEGVKVRLDWETPIIDIRNADDIKKHIIPLLSKNQDFLEEYEEVIDHEVKIRFGN